MALFKHIPELSIWEVSHYWHGYSPDETNPERLPTEVQGTLRVLAAAGARNFVLRVPPNSLRAKLIGPLFLLLLAIGLQWIANQAYLSRRFNKKVFDSLKIRREALARWCSENKIPLPSFWFPENEQVPHLNGVEAMKKLAGNHVLFPISLPGSPIIYDEKKPDQEEPDKAPPSTTTAQQTAAAKQAHADRNGIIDRFLRSIQGEIGTAEFNGTKSAQTFYQSLPTEEQLWLAQSPEKARGMTPAERQENAVKTLTRAITAFKKGQRRID